MGKLIIGDTMNKKQKKICVYLIILLSFFSYYEIKSNNRFGSIIRDIIFNTKMVDNKNQLTFLLNKELKEENKELKDLLDINHSLNDFKIINATIIERNNTYWLNELTIDKGSSDDIYNNQIVITKDGMIGKVIDTGIETSKIKLITSFDAPISVTINSINKVLQIDNYSLFIKDINNNDNIKVGDKVITSGLSDIFPKGILIGTIKEINKRSDGVGFIGKVELSANINNLRFVTVLKRENK